MPKLQSFYKTEYFKYEHMPFMREIATKKFFATRSYKKEASGFITTIVMLTIWEDLSSLQKLKLEEDMHALIL